MTKKTFRMVRSVVLALTLAASAAVALPQAGFAASEIKIVVNSQAITSYDIGRRVAFLRLQRQKGDLQAKAREQLVEEALKMQEARRINFSVGDAEVDASFARFAKTNKLTTQQLTQILNQAGVGPEHFKNFIRVQMTWPRIVNARYGRQKGMSTQDLVAKMLEKGGEKPSTTEYILQQVIFVVPPAKRSAILGARTREAEAMRARFKSCDTTTEFAKGLKDVSVRNLGRVLQPELPDAWKDQIEKTRPGGTTAVKTTDRGVEFIAVCTSKSVSDDVAAETVFRAESEKESGSDANSKAYLDDLKKRARIAYR